MTDRIEISQSDNVSVVDMIIDIEFTIPEGTPDMDLASAMEYTLLKKIRGHATLPPGNYTLRGSLIVTED